jgi:predicted nucleic acid-binding protein
LIRIERKPLLPINAGTAHIFGSLAALLLARGSQPRRRVQDLWIASQAIQNGFALLTRNHADFAGLPGLDLIPYSLPSPRI